MNIIIKSVESVFSDGELPSGKYHQFVYWKVCYETDLFPGIIRGEYHESNFMIDISKLTDQIERHLKFSINE